MKLIVGLGNYPSKYENTRHNFGFMMIDEIQQTQNFTPWKAEKKFKSLISYGEIQGTNSHEKVILIKPQTLMNLSGEAVKLITQFYKISPSNILVLSDDLDQSFGKIKFREKGSDGGQRGLRNIALLLGTKAFPRLKFGITNSLRKKIPTENFVLMNFTEEETTELSQILKMGLEKVKFWI